jgi:hypothetical protein
MISKDAKIVVVGAGAIGGLQRFLSKNLFKFSCGLKKDT